MDRILSYGQAILESTDQAMAVDPMVILFGLDVDDPKAILGTTAGLQDKYGFDRVFGTPLSEDAMTGAAIGMSLAGLRPIHVHIRMDFLMLAMNQLINVAAKSHYMYGGQVNVPIVIRSIIGKSWGQGAQHSQAMYPFFMHVPGIKVVAPATPYDAKGCLTCAIKDDNPVLFIEHRLLHEVEGYVPEDMFVVEPGQARVTSNGSDVTLVGISYMQVECLRAKRYLEQIGISAEVIDPIWLSPLDIETIVKSVRKTKNLCVVDNTWVTCGAGSEIVSSVIEELQGEVDIRVARLGFAPVTCPPTPVLEDLFYTDAKNIATTVNRMINGASQGWNPSFDIDFSEKEFRGPF